MSMEKSMEVRRTRDPTAGVDVDVSIQFDAYCFVSLLLSGKCNFWFPCTIQHVRDQYQNWSSLLNLHVLPARRCSSQQVRSFTKHILGIIHLLQLLQPWVINPKQHLSTRIQTYTAANPSAPIPNYQIHTT